MIRPNHSIDGSIIFTETFQVPWKFQISYVSAATLPGPGKFIPMQAGHMSIPSGDLWRVFWLDGPVPHGCLKRHGLHNSFCRLEETVPLGQTAKTKREDAPWIWN